MARSFAPQVVEAVWPARTDAVEGWDRDVVTGFDEERNQAILADEDVIQ